MGENMTVGKTQTQGAGDPVLTAFAERGFYVSETRGGSMRPLFHTHDSTVFILPLEGKAKKYDAVLYPGREGSYILHRVIGFGEGEYKIRGDSTYVTEHVKCERVVGILSEFVRRGKHHTVDERGYRIYVRLWHAIYHVRYVFHFLYLFAYRIYRKLFRRKRG
ncbi:MAG TPA: hypothetical protein DDY70_01040 [Clostridiales bacterium]|nr:hypothetical protein [Clostridiales bacterium]